MNWTVVVYFGPMFLVMVWWFVSARKWFKGPKVNVDHLMLGRDDNVIDGQGKMGDDASSTEQPPVIKVASADPGAGAKEVR